MIPMVWIFQVSTGACKPPQSAHDFADDNLRWLEVVQRDALVLDFSVSSHHSLVRESLWRHGGSGEVLLQVALAVAGKGRAGRYWATMSKEERVECS